MSEVDVGLNNLLHKNINHALEKVLFSAQEIQNVSEFETNKKAKIEGDGGAEQSE